MTDPASHLEAIAKALTAGEPVPADATAWLVDRLADLLMPESKPAGKRGRPTIDDEAALRKVEQLVEIAGLSRWDACRRVARTCSSSQSELADARRLYRKSDKRRVD
jgi:hypothetical protein